MDKRGDYRLKVRLLGEFELSCGDTPLPPPATLKACSLLAYLIVHRKRACSREQLACLFWPDRPRDKALHSLSTALWHIRRALPPGEYIQSDAQTVRFNPESDYWLDVQKFQALCDPSSSLGLIERLARAVTLYRGDFLEQHYDDWCLEERYRLEACYVQALGQLVAAHEALDQPEEALRCAELLLARDPLREDMYRAAIRLYVRLGNLAQAERLAGRCLSALHTELGVAPEPETIALCDDLLGPAWRREPIERVPSQPDLKGDARSRFQTPLERPPFVGRDAEWNALLNQWERARSGHGHLVWVGGESGIGKSRLVEELSEHIQRQGGLVVYSHCYEYEHALPYGPLADVLRGLLTKMSAHELTHLPHWQMSELIRLAPELGEGLAPLPRAQPEANREQARLFDALAFFLSDVASRNPLLLVLEDLHWANNSTLAWVHYLVRRLPQAPILLIATYRSDEVSPEHPLHGLVLQLEQRGLATRLELSRLPKEALARWMSVGASSILDQVYQQAEGNPFFTLETLRALYEAGHVRLVNGRWSEITSPERLPIPASAQQAIRLRLERLAPSTRQAVSVAAVIGQAFDLQVLEQACGQGEESTLEALDELLRHRLIREGQGPLSRDYVFDHHLAQEVIYEGLHFRRRQRLHRLVGEAMERLYAHQPGVAGELAHHFECAGESAKALNWLVKAGEEARRDYASQEALSYFKRALALLDAGRVDELAARALTGLAITYREVVGDEECVWGWLERALSIWETLGNRVGIAETHYALAYRHADFAQAQEQVRRGLRAVEGVGGLAEIVARGYGLLARFYEHAGEFAPARAWAQQQLELSERLNDPHELAHAHHRLGSLLLRMGGLMTEAFAHEREAARLADELGWLDFAAGSHNIAGYCLLALGRTAEAEAECRLALRQSTELQIPWRQCWACHYLAEIALLRGQYAQASTWLDQAEATMIHQSTHFQEIVLMRARGRLAARRGDPAAARSLFETALEMSRRFYPRYVSELELELAALSMDEGDESAAGQWLDRAREQAESRGVAHVLAIAGRLRAQLAARRGDWSAAEAAFAESLRRCEELEQVIEAARTRLAWGQALTSRDAARARLLLEAALNTLEKAEAAPEVAQARRLLD